MFCTIQHDENGVAFVIPNALKAAVLDPRHAAAEADALTIRDSEAVRDATIADALHLFAGANDDVDDNGLNVSMSACWPALCTKLRAAPAALEGPTRFSGGQIFKSTMHEKLIAWPVCRAARVFVSLPAGGAPLAPLESAFSSTSELLTK